MISLLEFIFMYMYMFNYTITVLNLDVLSGIVRVQLCSETLLRKHRDHDSNWLPKCEILYKALQFFIPLQCGAWVRMLHGLLQGGHEEQGGLKYMFLLPILSLEHFVKRSKRLSDCVPPGLAVVGAGLVASTLVLVLLGHFLPSWCWGNTWWPVLSIITFKSIVKWWLLK